MAEGKKKRSASARANSRHSDEERRVLIERTAYFKAAERGFAPGFEMQDWLDAEREVEQMS
jgi:hypothetical protein